MVVCRNSLIIVFAVLLLQACAQPTQKVPKYDAAELAKEEQLQREMAAQAAAAKGQIPHVSEQEIIARAQRVTSRVGPMGEQICKDMYGSEKNCTFKFVLDKEGAVNAYADGSKVHVTPAMVAFTANDEELAMVLAHEYAHNTLSHPQATGQNTMVGGVAGALADQLAASQGYNTGDAFSQAASNYARYKYSVDFEKEADYVGLYILARAGYDYTKAPEMWRRMSTYEPSSMYGGKSHPSNPDRFVGMNQTIKEINAKKASGTPLLPEKKPAKKSRWGF